MNPSLADIGDIYGWGWNESGQVGVQCMKTESGEVGKTDGVNLVAHPVLLFEDTPDVTFTSVSCGARHSAACTGKDTPRVETGRTGGRESIKKAVDRIYTACRGEALNSTIS